MKASKPIPFLRRPPNEFANELTNGGYPDLNFKFNEKFMFASWASFFRIEEGKQSKCGLEELSTPIGPRRFLRYFVRLKTDKENIPKLVGNAMNLMKEDEEKAEHDEAVSGFGFIQLNHPGFLIVEDTEHDSDAWIQKQIIEGSRAYDDWERSQ